MKTVLGIKKIGAAISVTANLSDLFDNLSGLASAYAKSIRAESFKNLALGVLAIAAAIFIVASIKFDKMWPAAVALAAIIGVVYLAVSAFTRGGKQDRIKHKKGEWDRKETIIDNDKVVGMVVNNLTGKTVPTTVFRIHYGDDGVHIVPDYPSKKKK